MIQSITFEQLKPLIKADIQANIAPLLLGRAGIGKSSLLQSLAEVFHTKVFSIAINQLGDTTDLTGVRLMEYLDPETQTSKYRMEAFPHASIDDCIAYAKAHPDETPILFMDEFNRTSPAITSAILSFTTERKIGTCIFPENIRFVLAGNDTGNINEIDEASITRFAIYRVKPDVETFIKVQPQLNRFVKETILEKPELLIAESKSKDINSVDFFNKPEFEQLTVPRTITAASRFLNQLNITGKNDNAEQSALKELSQITTNNVTLLYIALAAHTGETEFTKALVQKIMDYQKQNYQQKTVKSKQFEQVYKKLVPNKTIVEMLKGLNNYDQVMSFTNSLADSEKQKLLLWLTTKNAEKQIGKNYKALAPALIKQLIENQENIDLALFAELKEYKEEYHQILLDKISENYTECYLFDETYLLA